MNVVGNLKRITMGKDLDQLYENMERSEKDTCERWAKEKGYKSHTEWEESRNLTVARRNAQRRGLR